MPKAPDPPPPINVAATTAQDQQARLEGAQEGQALSTIGQNNPVGSLTYTTSIDPITGLPKYQANSQYTPEQQQIFDYLQGNQTSIGAGAGGAIGSNMGQYTSPFDLVGGANSLTQQAMDPAMANLERFMAPERDQKRTELLNQGIMEGSPTYQLEMDKVQNQQDLTKGQMISSFMPQASQMALNQYTTPMSMIAQMMGLSQPGNINQNLVNTPQANPGATDVAGLTSTAQQQAFQNYQMQVASQNALLGGGLGLTSNILKLPMSGGGSVGGSMIGSIMGL